jgi:MFS family permease
MFYQLKSFDQSLPDSTIAAQAGLMASSFTGAQFLTAMMWGKVSDSEKGGRKMVLLVGLFGTSMNAHTEKRDLEY